MFDKDLVRTHIHDGEYGTAFVTITVSGRRVWISDQLHLTRKMAEGWVKDFKRALKDNRCVWDNIVTDRIDHFGDLDRDLSDILGFCSDDCYDEAMKEAEAAL